METLKKEMVPEQPLKDQKDEKIRKIINALHGVSHKDWMLIKKWVDLEYNRMSMKNTLINTDSVIGKVFMEMHF